MASGFAPEFLLLMGVDIFLGASILTALLDKHFPAAFPYILDAAALVGFAELVTGPSFMTTFSIELQFYYSFAYALISVLTLLGLNLYLLFLRNMPFESAMLGVFATVPAGLGILYFTSAFVNGLALSLPIIPVVQIWGVYALFGMSTALIVFALATTRWKLRPRSELEPRIEVPIEEPFPARVVESGREPVSVSRVVDGSSNVGEASAGARSSSEGPIRNVPSARTLENVSKGGRGFPQGALTGEANPEASELRLRKHGEEGVVRAVGGTGMSQIETGAVALATFKAEGQVTNPGAERKQVYAERLVELIKFFESVVSQPVRFDPKALGEAGKGVRFAHLTPGGIVLMQDFSGKTTPRSLLDFSTDEAMRIMRGVMQALRDMGVRDTGVKV